MEYNYPTSFWFIAKQIGYGRNVMNCENNKLKTHFDRGVKNEHVDTLGILGELIVIDYLTNNNKNFKMANMLDFKSSKNADIIINDKKIDIKTNLHSDHSHLLVNEEAHKKGLNAIDFYWFVYVLNNFTVKFYFVEYDDVSKWNCKLMKYTKAYYIKRELL